MAINLAQFAQFITFKTFGLAFFKIRFVRKSIKLCILFCKGLTLKKG